jgi:hypothetical protein
MAAVLVVATAIAVVVLTGGVVVLRRRSRRSSGDEDLVRAVDEMRLRMDALAGELAEALDRAERESRRNRLFGELGGSIDIEEIVDRVLDAAMAIPGFDAAMIAVEGHGGTPTVGTRAMTDPEAANPPTSGVAGALPGTITVSYR